MSPSPSLLRRMILVDVTWSEWQPDQDRPRYEQIVKNLVQPLTRNSAEREPVYVHQCHEEDRGDTSWTASAGSYELPPADVCQKPDQWLVGTEGLDRVLRALHEEEAMARESGKTLRYEVPGWRKLFRTRIFISAERFRHLAEVDGDLDYWALIDMRFQWITAGSVLWHTSFALWSDLPWSLHHRSPDVVAPRDHAGLSPEDASHLIGDYEKSRLAFRKFINAPDRSMLCVFGRYYQPPRFLVAVPDIGSDAGNGGVQDQESSVILPVVANAILGTRHYELLPRAPLKSGADVFRRFLPEWDRDRPRYLLIPDTRASARISGKNQESLRGLQEEATATCITILTDLEAYAASKLGGIESRMRTRENHLRIYQGVAEQAGTLWDALARLLPDARKDRLEKVHRSIETIHQTLLQGVAELDQLGRDINGALSHIGTTADEITDRFDRELAQPSQEQKAALRESLRGGYIDRLRRYVNEASGTAIRVTDSYRMLLDTIGLAFDERRVREGDRLQKASMWIAVAFGVLGLSGVAQATLPLPAINGLLVWLVQISLWVVTSAALGAIAYQFYKLRGVGQVTSRAFEERYKVVRGFLAEVSTDHLDRFRREQFPVDDLEREVNWQELDHKLTKEFICAWASADQAEACVRPDSYEAAELRIRVEAWTLRTLLLTERPRDFGLYPLPYLTCLYRVCGAQALKDWRTPDEMASADSAVGAEELQRVLTTAQYEWFQRNEKDLLGVGPEAVYKKLELSGKLPDIATTRSELAKRAPGGGPDG
jgi:hypothetical protein